MPSLPEAHRTIAITPGLSWFKKILAFAGPGYLVAVGYMDPGNWATDIGGGSKFGYTLLSVILLSNLMAMLLQALSAKLGIVTGRDLAQACRESYSKPVAIGLWIVCEIAIAACDLAEVLGSAVALKLLFGLPLLAGVLITGLDVLIVLALQGRGFRLIEAFVVTLILTIAACFAYEIFYAKPLWREAAVGFIPRLEILRNREMLYIAIGILGATVMPHNLYLHSSIVQTRAFGAMPRLTPHWRWRLRCSSTPRSWCSVPPRFTPAACTMSRKLPMPTNFSRRCSVPASPARCLPVRCLLPGRTPR
jgi:manganese transport protein